MILKKLGAVLLVALVMNAVVAGTAQAMWNLEGLTGTSESGWSETGTFRQAPNGGFVLAGTVVAHHLKLSAEGIKGIKTSVAQNGELAQVIGSLDFIGVSIVEPAGCKSASSIETVPLTGTALMGDTETTKSGLYIKLVPTSGEVFATIKLEGEGCAAAGSYQLKGTLYAKATNPTGVHAVWQEVSFSGAINSSQGGALTLGKEAATLAGAMEIGLTSGVPFADVE